MDNLHVKVSKRMPKRGFSAQNKVPTSARHIECIQSDIYTIPEITQVKLPM